MTAILDPTVRRALLVLNDALERDPQALTHLVNARISCNEKMIGHPTVQVKVDYADYKIGILGLINGILGYKRGGIGAEGELDPSSGRFMRIRRFIYTKAATDEF